ncbi:hypothetical protein C8R11_1065 [Nitrosomonas aestuarii]|nr:hypothetical protein C8R11_1065 [Nitrosomonas aestuarii]
MHRQFRKLTKTKGAFQNENSLLKLPYAGILNATEKWTMSVQNWTQVLSQLDLFLKIDWIMCSTPEHITSYHQAAENNCKLCIERAVATVILRGQQAKRVSRNAYLTQNINGL